MTIGIHDDKRRVIPRWRKSGLTGQTGELDALLENPVSQVPDPTEFEDAIEEWRSERTLGTAFEVLAGGLALNRLAEARPAAQFVMGMASATPLSRSLAQMILETSTAGWPPEANLPASTLSNKEDYKRIALSKRMLFDYPNNPLLWADLARAYILIGQARPALWAMDRALACAPMNRYILRSASRLYIHRKDPKRALELLRKSPATLHDPWLLAAFLATSEVAEAPPESTKRAMDMVNSNSFSLLQRSELASALGSLQFAAGNPKMGRRLIRQSLVTPTENAVAQAVWMARRIKTIEVHTDVSSLNRPFEAQARLGYSNANWKEAAQACRKWSCDEAFSARPTCLGSFLACTLLENPGLGVQFSDLGLRANPDHPVLLNNKVVALMDLGRTDEAMTIFRAIRSPSQDPFFRATVLATEGLIQFRLGDYEEGRRLYLQAAEVAGANPPLKAMVLPLVLLHFAKEELRIGREGAERLLPEAEAACKDFPDPAIQALLTRLKNALEVQTKPDEPPLPKF